MNSASASETSSTMITTAGKGHQNLPVVPGRYSNGTKAMTLVRMLKITGRAMSCVPRIAASMRLIPRCRYS